MTTAVQLSGVRQAVFRSACVATGACALVGAVASLLPGTAWASDIVGPGGIQTVVDYQVAGGVLLTVVLVAVALVAAMGALAPRREAVAFVAGALAVLGLPLGMWLGLGAVRDPGVMVETLPPAAVLVACVRPLVVVGPALGLAWVVLARLERRAHRPVPRARQV
ncbi:MAG: hypothetical protein R3B06_12230 [Kofleriaceae bacterium]